MSAHEKIKPDHVAILGLGPSSSQYFYETRCAGSRKALFDEVWAINAYGADIAQCDMILHMDDFRIQEARAAAKPDSNIAAMLRAIRQTKIPIMTCRKYDEYPTSMEFPLERVLNDVGFCYFNNTAPYGVAYALLLGVKKISLYGCDYTYPNSHDAESGRACLEFWLSKALDRGVEVWIPGESTLMDSNVPMNMKPYGFCDTRKVSIFTPGNGEPARIIFEDRDPPTAAEIERRYDHSGLTRTVAA